MLAGGLLQAKNILKNGEYEIKRKIGEGAMGEVFEAVRAINHQRVAIKVSETKEDKERLENEGNLLRCLASIVFPSFIDAFDENNKKYLVMELVEGINLDDDLKQNGPMPEDKVKEICFSLAIGLEHLHSKGIVYRDLKPANIVMNRNGFIKIIDFGVAKIKNNNTDNTGIGTQGFAAPEQYCKNSIIDERTDIYNLGSTLITLLTNEVKAFYLQKLVLPKISPSFVKFLQKAIELKPADRHQTIKAMKDALVKVKIATPKPQKQAAVANANQIKIWNGWNCGCRLFSKHLEWLIGAPILLMLSGLIFGALGFLKTILPIFYALPVSFIIITLAIACKFCIICFILNCLYVPINLLRLLWRKIKSWQIGAKIVNCLKKIKIGDWSDAKRFIFSNRPWAIAITILFLSWLFASKYFYLDLYGRIILWIFIFAIAFPLSIKNFFRSILHPIVMIISLIGFVAGIVLLSASDSPVYVDHYKKFSPLIIVSYMSPIKMGQETEINWRFNRNYDRAYIVLKNGEQKELPKIDQNSGKFKVILTRPTTLRFLLYWDNNQHVNSELIRLVPSESENLIDNKPIKF